MERENLLKKVNREKLNSISRDFARESYSFVTDKKNGSTQNYEVVVAKWEELWNPEEFSGSRGWLEWLSIYFRKKDEEIVHEINTKVIETKGFRESEEKAKLQQYCACDFKVVDYDKMIAAWSDKEGNFGLTYKIDFHKTLEYRKLKERIFSKKENYETFD
jgi:hypothetical protein